MRQQVETEGAEQRGYAPEEYREVVRRAQRIRADREGRLSHEALAESAAEVGIREEDLKEAERQLREERRHRERQRVLTRNIGLAVAAVLALFMVFTYNSLNMAREAVYEQRGNLQAVLQRRADLAQQLVPLVREGAEREQEVLTRIADARRDLRSGDLAAQARAASELNQGLNRLLAIAESNPQVRSTELYQTLQTQIEGSENRVAEYRRRYNAAVTDYNRKAQSFPTNVVRPVFGFPGRIPNFEATGDVEQAPRL